MATASASSSAVDATVEGPVLSLLTKRRRALRKKLNRITQMEEALSQGKVLNKEQEETLRSKSSVLAGIDELEKLRPTIAQALDQEIQLAVEKNQKTDAEASVVEPGAGVEAEPQRDVFAGVSDLLNLLYFGTIFDVKTLMGGANDNMLLTRTHERNSCLTYDYVTDDDAAGDLLKEWDLDLISTLARMMISRPVNSSSSHNDALRNCVEHVKLWVENSEQPIETNSNITYAYVKQKLHKIMASDYFTTTPEIKASVEMAAAAAGNYTSFPVPLQGAVVPPSGVADSYEVSYEEYGQQEEQSNDFYGEEIYKEQNGPVEELHQHEENSSEVQDQTELSTGDAKVDDNDRDINHEEHPPSRRPPYQNYRGHRGGRGRRPYTPGRGWRGGSRGGYQNGNSQFYDQPYGYYHRNTNFRGRGGRGPSGQYAAHVEAES